MTVRDPKTAPSPAIFIIHSRAQAVAAATAAADAGRAVVLRSARGAAGYGGAAWFFGLVDRARAEVPEADISAVLDCADDLAVAIEAVRAEAEHAPTGPAIAIRFDGPAAAHQKITDIAARLGIPIDTSDAPAADLRGSADPARAARKILGH